MRTKTILVILVSIILIPLIGCEKSSNPVQVSNMNNTQTNDSVISKYMQNRLITQPTVEHMDATNAARYATNVIAGNVIQTQKDTSNNVNVWKVTIQTLDSAIVELKISIDYGIIIEIKGLKGPFNYNIIPSSQFITLLQALDSALVNLPGQIVGWDVSYFKNKGWKFTVYIQTDSGLYYIRIEASSGKAGKHHHEGDNDDGDDND